MDTATTLLLGLISAVSRSTRAVSSTESGFGTSVCSQAVASIKIAPATNDLQYFLDPVIRNNGRVLTDLILVSFILTPTPT